MINNAWKIIRLGDVCEKIGSGATPRGGSTVYLSSGKYALIRSQNVYNSGFTHSGLAYITEKHAQELDGVEVRKSDVLLNITGDSVGRCCQVDEKILPARVNQHVSIIRPRHNLLDPKFLKYYLISAQMQAHLLSLASGGGTRNALTKSMIENFQVPCPPLAEQRAIAEILGALDDKIELNRQMNHTLEELAQALFTAWFVNFDPVTAKAAGRRPFGMTDDTAALFPDRFTDSALGPIPSGWRIMQLSEMVEIVDCLHSKKPSRTEKGGILLQLDNIRDDGLLDLTDKFYISEDDYGKWISRMEAQKGDCVITNVGRVGAVAQIPSEVKAALGRNMTGLRCKKTYFYPSYLVSALLSDFMKEEIDKNTDHGTILNALNVKNISKLRLIVPDRRILDLAETRFNSFRSNMECNHQESLILSELRDTLLPRLLSGAIRVRAAWPAVARAL